MSLCCSLIGQIMLNFVLIGFHPKYAMSWLGNYSAWVYRFSIIHYVHTALPRSGLGVKIWSLLVPVTRHKATNSWRRNGYFLVLAYNPYLQLEKQVLFLHFILAEWQCPWRVWKRLIAQRCHTYFCQALSISKYFFISER